MLSKKMRERVEQFRIARVKHHKRIWSAMGDHAEVVFLGRPEPRENGGTTKSLFILYYSDLTPRAREALEVLVEEHDKATANFIRARDKAAEIGGHIGALGNGRYVPSKLHLGHRKRAKRS